MAGTAAKEDEPTQQDVCIDLPGETVQCWRSSDNIKVVLRKHRDVIFDLNLASGNGYTVESTGSDFYNAGKKKLMYAKRRDVVTFKDGERVHLWVTRSFQGALILKCNGKTLVKIEPNEIDKHQYDSAATTKPAPIIVALGAETGAKTPSRANPIAKTSMAQLISPPSASAPVDEECSVVCVVEGTMKNIPTEIAEYLKEGGGNSGLADIDPFQVATRNWIGFGGKSQVPARTLRTIGIGFGRALTVELQPDFVWYVPKSSVLADRYVFTSLDTASTTLFSAKAVLDRLTIGS